MSEATTGRRNDVDPCDHEPGDYGFWHGRWYCRPPWKHAGGCLGDGMDAHRVAVHEDGTITASPSILIRIDGHSEGSKEWHGFLERGVWRQC